MTDAHCLVCGSHRLEDIFSLSNVPVFCNVLWPTEDGACGAPRGDVDLALCHSCGLVFNRSFDPGRMTYASGYENSLHHSPSFRAFAEALCSDLVARHHLAGGRIVEIGCGDGFMLDLMCRHGVAEAVGYDPSMDGRHTPYAASDAVRIVPEYFDAGHAADNFQAVLCRHVLEHLPDPAGELAGLRRVLGERDVPVYFEVPNAEWMLRTVSLWDVIYEHVTYWTPPAIETLFRRAGFVLERIHAGYGDQFLQVEARPGPADPDFLPQSVADVRRSASAFGEAARAYVTHWRERLGAEDRRVVLWGAGSKGISFANALGERAGALVALVDLNPRKHGLRVAGAGLPVVAPDALAGLDPDLVLISNALYEAEIRQHLERFGLRPDIQTITS